MTTTTKITSHQKRQISRLVEGALEEAGLAETELDRLVEQGCFEEDFAALIRRHSGHVPSVAREVLGEDFISPGEIAAARGLNYTEKQLDELLSIMPDNETLEWLRRYSKEQLAELERTLPDRETLEWLHRNGYLLVAGPPQKMTIRDVRRLRREYFYTRWEDSDFEGRSFSIEEKVSCRWYMVRKGVVPGSTNKTWSEQQGLLSDVEAVPTAVELVWALTTHMAVRGEFMLRKLRARTSSVVSTGSRVVVGYWKGRDCPFVGMPLTEGLDIGVFWGDDGFESVGLASVRKPDA